MARIPDNYLGPKARIVLFKKEHGVNGSIETETNQLVVGETLCVMIKATVKVNGQVVATGHAFTSSPEEDKEVEKTETVAVGRALVHAGYPEHDIDISQSDNGQEQTSLKKKSTFLSKLSETKNKEAVETDSEEGEEEPSTEEPNQKEEEAPSKKKMTKEELLAKFSKK